MRENVERVAAAIRGGFGWGHGVRERYTSFHSLSLVLLSTKVEGAVGRPGGCRSRTGTAPAGWRSGAAWPRGRTSGLGHAAAARRCHRSGRRCRGAGVRRGTAGSAAPPSHGNSARPRRRSCRRWSSRAPRLVIDLSTVLSRCCWRCTGIRKLCVVVS